VSWLRQLVADLLPRRSGFDTKSVHARSVVDPGTRFSPSTTALFCQYHPTDAPHQFIYQCRWNQWPRGLRRGSVASRLLGLWVWIPPGGMGICLLWVLCVVRLRSLRRNDHSSRGVLESVMCLSVIVKHRWLGLYEGWNFNSGNYLFTTDTK